MLPVAFAFKNTILYSRQNKAIVTFLDKVVLWRVKHWHYLYSFWLKGSAKSQKCLLSGSLYYLMYIAMLDFLFITSKCHVTCQSIERIFSVWFKINRAKAKLLISPCLCHFGLHHQGHSLWRSFTSFLFSLLICTTGFCWLLPCPVT